VGTTWSGSRHEHDHAILATFPVEIGVKTVSWSGYRRCACGHRVPAAVAAVPAPRIGDRPYADYAAMPPRPQRLRGTLRSWLRGGVIALAWLAVWLLAAGRGLIQLATVRRAAGARQDGKSHRAFDDISALPGADLRSGHLWPVWGGLVRPPPTGDRWRRPY